MIAHNLTPRIKGLLLALFPPLSIYHLFPGLSLGMVMLIIFIPFDFLFSRPVSLKRTSTGMLIGVFIVVNLISFNFNYYYIEYPSFVNNLLALFIFIVVITYYLNSQIDKNVLKKSLLFFALIFSVIILIQSFSYVVFGQSISFLLPLETDLGEGNIDSIQFAGRPNGVFQEPSHYAIFVAPMLYLAIKEGRIWMAVVFAMGMFFSTSTFGLLSVVIIGGISLSKSRYGLKAAVGGLVFFLVLFLAFSDFILPVLEQNILKSQRSLDIDNNVRLLGGAEGIPKMELEQLIFGVGFNQLKGFMTYNGLENPSNYSNSILYSFYSGGVIGLGALLFYLAGLYHVNKDKVFLLLLLLTLCVDQILFNQNFFYLLTIIYFVNPAINENSSRNQ